MKIPKISDFQGKAEKPEIERIVKLYNSFGFEGLRKRNCNIAIEYYANGVDVMSLALKYKLATTTIKDKLGYALTIFTDKKLFDAMHKNIKKPVIKKDVPTVDKMQKLMESAKDEQEWVAKGIEIERIKKIFYGIDCYIKAWESCHDEDLDCLWDEHINFINRVVDDLKKGLKDVIDKA